VALENILRADDELASFEMDDKSHSNPGERAGFEFRQQRLGDGIGPRLPVKPHQFEVPLLLDRECLVSQTPRVSVCLEWRGGVWRLATVAAIRAYPQLRRKPA
jgi:hypothetical protein